MRCNSGLIFWHSHPIAACSTNVSVAGKICNKPDIRWISRGMGSDLNTVVRWIFEPKKSLPNTDYSVIL